MASVKTDESATVEGEPPFDTPVPEAPAQIQLPSNPLVLLQAAQFTLLFIGALYLTRTIVLAVLLKLLLQSGVRRLERIHVPRAVAALVMITAGSLRCCPGSGTSEQPS